MKYERLLNFVTGQVWAIDPHKARAILNFLSFAAQGGKYSDEELQARIGDRKAEKIKESPGNVAVVPLMGVLSQRGGMTATSEPLTSVDNFRRMINAAANDEQVKTIIIWCDSPGGSVYGVQEAGDAVFAAREKKPVIAQVDSQSFSAGYWIASQANEIVCTPGGDVGSIGVWMLHEDISQWLEKEGIKETFIYSGKYKVEGNPFEPLQDETREYIQHLADAAYKQFVDAVARGRGITAKEVIQNYGEGRILNAADALKAGMIDRIATIDETVARYHSGSAANQHSRRAEKLELKEKAFI